MKKRLGVAGILFLLVLTLVLGMPTTASAVEGVSLSPSFKVDREYVYEGDYIGFLFTFKNTGTVTISNLAVRDSKLANNNWLNSPLTLAPGETRVVTYNLPLNHEITVSPVVKYSAGGTDYSYSFGSKRLYIIDDDIKMSLEASTTNPAAGEEVTFKVTMTNNGNVPLRKLKLYNHNNELVPLKGTQLYSKNTASVTTTATFKESASVQFDITAEDAYGTIYSAASNTINISVPINFDESDLTVSAEADSSKLSLPGPATFDVLITNNSEYSLYDITVTDIGTEEVVATITNMEKGERLVRVKTPVEETREIAFRVEVHDADGKLFTVDTTDNPTEVTILSQEAEEEAAQASAVAEATPTPSPSEAPASGLASLSVWTLAVIGFGVAMLIVIIIIAILIAAAHKRGGGEPKPKKPKKEKVKGVSNPPKAPAVKPVPKRRPSGPKKKSKKKHKGPIRVSYRDRGSF